MNDQLPVMTALSSAKENSHTCWVGFYMEFKDFLCVLLKEIISVAQQELNHVYTDYSQSHVTALQQVQLKMDFHRYQRLMSSYC
jgi:hypothetical protein